MSSFLACVVVVRPRWRFSPRSDQSLVEPPMALAAARQQVRPDQRQIWSPHDWLDMVDFYGSPSAALTADGLPS